MTKNEKEKLYEVMCNDFTCGVCILTPRYVDELLAKYTEVYRMKLRRIKRAVRKIE